jgi:alkylation response protein AidB-like acyl-CoA dehydrogenase
MYPLLKVNPARAAWISNTAKSLQELGDRHRDALVDASRALEFPRAIYQELGSLGYLGPLVPTEFGGSGWGVPEYVVISEEVGRHGLVSGQIAVQGQKWLLDWGTEEQKAQWLGPIATGAKVFSESISEPTMGSSFKNMKATATRDGDDWILNGHKTHVNLGADSEVTIFYGLTPDGITSFLVDTSFAGVSTKVTDAIGLRLIRTADVIFDNVRVSDASRIGPVGGGLETFLSTFNISRLGNASELIGLGRRALEIAINYGNTRIVGTTHVTEFQGIQWMMADAWTSLQSASFARDHAALAHEQGEDISLATTVAKRLAITAAELAMDTAFSMTGGEGLYHESPLLEISNDLRVLKVAGGSQEIMRNYIARSILKSPDHEGLA